MTQRILRYCSLSTVFFVLVVGYTNCDVVNPTHSAGHSSFGIDPSLAAFCNEGLKDTFSKSYYPVFTEAGSCVQCHSDAGVSPFKLASNNLTSAFNTFLQIGIDQVDQTAVNPSHAAGVTGPAMQSRVTGARATWNPGFKLYKDCIGGAVEALRLVNRTTPELYFGDGKVETLTWDLTGADVVPATARFPGIFMLDVRVRYENVGGTQVATGYSFSFPRIRMLSGELEIEVEGIVVYINDLPGRSIEPLLSARNTARGIDPTNIFNGTVVSPTTTVSNVDKIGVGFGYFNLRGRTDNPPSPPTPILSVPNPFARTTQVPISISGDAGARLWCITASNVRPSSTAANCPGYETATSNGWQISRPTQFDLAKVGRAVQQGETVSMYLWVANSDLKINLSPATGQVTFDAQPPAAPSLSSVTVSTSQIADINGLSDAAEPVSWCVKESAIQTDVQTAQNCRFQSSKPSFVGFTGGGNRFVSVFVRDQAGNTSAASNIVSANNPFGRITFVQLTDIANGARAVFANRCASCHGAGMPQVGIWNSSDYANTVAAKTRLLNRLNNLAGRPEAGLDPKENALIQLWLTQTTTPVQQ